MSTFFSSLGESIQIVARQAEETYKLVQAIYKKFHNDYGLQIITPRMFPVKKYTDELELLTYKSNEFRNSAITTMTEQSFVVKKFFISLVSHARNLFQTANKEADSWLKEVINPLVTQIQEKRNSIEQHMKTLSKIKESKGNLEAQITEHKAKQAKLEEQVKSLKDLRETLQNCTPPESGSTLSGSSTGGALH